MEIFDKIRQVLRFLVNCLSLWIATGRWEDPPVLQGETPDYGGYIWRWCYHVRQETRETNVAVEFASGQWARAHVLGCPESSCWFWRKIEMQKI